MKFREWVMGVEMILGSKFGIDTSSTDTVLSNCQNMILEELFIKRRE
jgi:hypothetical protein